MRTAMSSAFSLIELLVVIAVIALLAALLLPALGKSKARAQGIQCLSNLRQLSTAWQLYTSDNSERYPVNGATSHAHPEVGEDAQNPSWVAGVLDPTGWNWANRNDNTNAAKLVDPAYQAAGSLGAYTKDVKLYLCPSDRSLDPLSGRPRVRSLAMNGWVNPGRTNPADSACWRMPFHKFARSGDCGRASPSDIFLFLDEHPESINDGWFWVSVNGYAQGQVDLSALDVHDLPAIYHNLSSAFTFLDGHAEMHRWTDPNTLALQFNSHNQPTPNNRDIAWLMTHATVPE